MLKRIVMGFILIVVSVSLILHSKWAMTLLVFPVGALGGFEFYKLAVLKGIKPSFKNGIASIILIYLGALFLQEPQMLELLTALFIATILTFVFRKEFHVSSFLDAGVTIMGYVYIGWFFSLIFHLRDVQGDFTAYGAEISKGAAMVLFLVLANSASDIGGYFIGKSLGAKKLCPKISPNKTIGGCIGAIISAVITALITGEILHFSPLSSISFGLLISITAQIGDLWESTLKRDVDVKDSGDAIPGHGGILDRFDSLFFSTPIAYYLFKYMIGF